MEQHELLRLLCRQFEDLGLRYFITGSTVTIFFGEPRFTNDIDVVVELPANAVARLCARFPASDFYVSEDAAIAAVRDGTQFNIIHPRSGLKIDVMVPRPSEFNRSRFSRVRRVAAGDDWTAAFSSPEDAILKKLEYYREGGSDKHLRDIAGVIGTMRQELDVGYIEQWATRLGVADLWRQASQRWKT
jgi:hypothetical protein